MTLKKIYEELRKAEWEGKTLEQFITKLETEFPELRETDAQLEAGHRIGLEGS
jgi:hypothetical protein